MTDNNELKETEIKNCVYYYFKNMVNINDLGSKNVQKYTQKKIKIFSFTIMTMKHQIKQNPCIFILIK